MNDAYFKQEMPIGLIAVAQRTSAAIVAFTTLRLLMVVYDVELNDPHQALLIIVTLLAFIFFHGSPLSEIHVAPHFRNTAVSTLWTWCAFIGVLLLLGWATKTSTTFSRKLLSSWVILTPLAILLVRWMIDHYVIRLARSRLGKRHAIVAGVNENARMLAEKIQASPHVGIVLEGHFDDRGAERLGDIGCQRLLGKLSELPEYVRRNRVDLIYIALPLRNIQRVTELLDDLHDTTASIYYVPDVFVFDLVQCRTGDIDGLPVVALCETPFYGSRGIVKRASDFAIALGLLVLLSPLLALIAAAIKFTTPGSVIFKQRRYGLDGREINVYKFRTMYVSEDSDRVRQATKDDERITRIGAILRRYSLDELPQFFNVLQGHMSVVGPRPHAVAHNEEYRRLIKGYMIRHKVNPGLTGLAQVRGFRGETATVEDMRKRVEADLEYLRNWSLQLDMRIIIKTALLIFWDKKAY